MVMRGLKELPLEGRIKNEDRCTRASSKVVDRGYGASSVCRILGMEKPMEANHAFSPHLGWLFPNELLPMSNAYSTKRSTKL